MTDVLALLGGPEFVGMVLRVLTPILLAALGVLISERAGVLNIGVEGIMLAGAFAGVVVSAWTGGAWTGLLAALVVGGLIGALLAFCIHVLKADLILAGIAVNISASGATTLLLYTLTGDKGMSGSLPSKTLPNIDIPGLRDLGTFGQIVSGHHVLTYAALLAVPLMSLVMLRTPFGLRLRAIGENPAAAVAAGIPVVRLQFVALVISGVLAAMAGAFLSMGYVSWFAQNMSAGRGFIALAAEVMGQGSAWGTLAASLVLACAESLAIVFRGAGLPSELMQMVPYVVPVLALLVHAMRRARVARRLG